MRSQRTGLIRLSCGHRVDRDTNRLGYGKGYRCEQCGGRARLSGTVAIDTGAHEWAEILREEIAAIGGLELVVPHAGYLPNGTGLLDALGVIVRIEHTLDEIRAGWAA